METMEIQIASFVKKKIGDLINTKTLNVGIIACSKVATKRFIPALIKAKNAKLYMVGS